MTYEREDNMVRKPGGELGTQGWGSRDEARRNATTHPSRPHLVSHPRRGSVGARERFIDPNSPCLGTETEIEMFHEEPPPFVLLTTTHNYNFAMFTTLHILFYLWRVYIKIKYAHIVNVET